MKLRKILLYVLPLLMGGCVPVMSLHPLFEKKNLVFEEKLLGTWVGDPNDPDETWQFKRLEEENEKYDKAYTLILSDEGEKKGEFVACLVKLQDRLFLDVFPDKFPSGKHEAEEMKLPFNALFFAPLHLFIKVDSIEPALKMRLTDNEQIQKLLEQDPNALKHEVIEERIVLTASTEQLQAFVLKHAEKLFTDDIVMARKKTEETDKSDQTGR